ncbi:MAG TPA: isoprenylcysteine carboxylmethyltransferase family protein [Longimicrobiales bacterium]|nr:isoprenylcysteine carboxylmethyltransferase family protein [Longimicrobiales bacterium]
MSTAHFLWLMATTALVLPFLDVWRWFGRDWVERAIFGRAVLGVLELAALGAWWLVRGRWRLLPEDDVLLAIAGAILALTGALLVAWSKRTLGRLFSPQLGVQRGHRLITSGPFAIVRHPIYLGVIDYIFGSALVFHDAALLALAGLYAVFFTLQLRLEEAIFRRHFGAEWEAYRARVPALLPRLRPGRTPR